MLLHDRISDLLGELSTASGRDAALPQLARATVNCRILPDQPVDSVEAELRRIVR